MTYLGFVPFFPFAHALFLADVNQGDERQFGGNVLWQTEAGTRPFSPDSFFPLWIPFAWQKNRPVLIQIGGHQAIFHSLIRLVWLEKPTPILKSFRVSAAKGLA